MTHILENWLGAEPLLEARLKDQVPELRAVYLAADLASIEAPKDPRAEATPAVHLFYLGDQIGSGRAASGGQGEVQVVDQLFGAVLVANNAKGAAAVRSDIGPLIPKVIKALAGWDCGLVGMQPFRRAAIRTPPSFKNGRAIFPLFFSARVIA